MSIISGEVQEPFPNVFIGVTNFIEFSLGAGIPTGITGSGLDNPGAPDTFEIANVAQEGNYFAMSGHDALNAQSLFSIDAFDGDWWPTNPVPEIEILARLFIGPTSRSNHFMLGVGHLLDGDLVAEIDAVGHVGQKASGPNIASFIGDLLNGSLGTLGGTVIANPALNTWAWVRFRYEQNAGIGTRRDWRTRMWIGDIADEPGTWTTQALNNVNQGNEAAQRMGMFFPQGITPGIDQDEQRCAFFSFSTDWTQAAPPRPEDLLNPGDIIPPTVTVDPIQDTWVGLSGTPFEVVP